MDPVISVLVLPNNGVLAGTITRKLLWFKDNLVVYRTCRNNNDEPVVNGQISFVKLQGKKVLVGGGIDIATRRSGKQSGAGKHQRNSGSNVQCQTWERELGWVGLGPV